MLFALYCLDKPGHLQVRLDNRPAHLDYLKAAGDKLKIGGPILSPDGQSPIGSLLVLDFADQAAAQAFATNDPYAKAGLFQSVAISPWRMAAGHGITAA